MLKCMLFAILVHHVHAAARIRVYKSWKNVDYNFPASVSRSELIKNGNFIPNNVAPLDVDVFKYNKCGQKIFVSTPRLRPGTPVTLSTLDENGRLNPYPSWNWQSDRNCSRLISVLRMTIDESERLWVLDDGKANAFEDAFTFICPPKVVIFNLETDEMIGSYEVPTGLYTRNNSLFANIAVDSRQPDKAFAFLADAVNAKLVVFNFQNESFWEWDHPTINPVPPYTEFRVNGVNFTLPDGVLALAYYPKRDRLFFNSFASVTQHSIAGQFLRNGQRLARNVRSHLTSFNRTRVSQTAVHALSKNGIMFFSPVSENSIRCWDVSTRYTRANHPIVAKDDDRLQFITGMKVRDGRYWGLSTRLQKFIIGTTSPNETNYRIVTQSFTRLVRGTKCDICKKRSVRRLFHF